MSNNFGWSDGQLHNSADTDWLANATDDTSREVMAARVAGQAKAWFQRLPEIVLSDRSEFRIQASAEAQRVAAPYDLQREAAEHLFVRSAANLFRLAEEDKAEDEAEETSEETEEMPAEDEEAIFEEAPAEDGETSEETKSEPSEGKAEEKSEDKAEKKEGRRRTAASNLPPGVSDYDIPGVMDDGELLENQYFIDGVVADEGTVVVFSGYDGDSNPVTITVDHRMAQSIIDQLSYNDVLVEAENWQVTRMGKRTARRRTAANVTTKQRPTSSGGYPSMGNDVVTDVLVDGKVVGSYSYFMHFDGDGSGSVTPESLVTGEVGHPMWYENAIDWIVERASGGRTSRRRTAADEHGNTVAEEGVTRCWCGSKYWENDQCVDCGQDACKMLKDKDYKEYMASRRRTAGVGGDDWMISPTTGYVHSHLVEDAYRRYRGYKTGDLERIKGRLWDKLYAAASERLADGPERTDADIMLRAIERLLWERERGMDHRSASRRRKHAYEDDPYYNYDPMEPNYTYGGAVGFADVEIDECPNCGFSEGFADEVIRVCPSCGFDIEGEWQAWVDSGMPDRNAPLGRGSEPTLELSYGGARRRAARRRAARRRGR